MTKLTFTEDELLADHEYVEPQIVAGVRLHGGFLADGTYQPPRARVREVALTAWEQALAERGGEPLGASAELLAGERFPNVAQQLVLLRNGLGQHFWNTLTIIGKIEAKGRFMPLIPVPDLQAAVVEDVSQMSLGHLDRGLFVAHGLDEGGDPARGIGGHDAMWFAARDLVFGPHAYPDVEPENDIARPETGKRYLPEIDEEVESLFSFLANLLIIEFRAELGFAETQAILRSPGVFTDRREQAEQAAEIVERIRTDETIHVRSLNLYLGELRSVTLRCTDGGTVAGSELVDRFWDGMVRWATVEQPALAAAAARERLSEYILGQPDGSRILGEFEAAA